MIHRPMLTAVASVAIAWSASPVVTPSAHGAEAPREAPDDCADSKGAAYGPGWTLTIDGRKMKCVGPHWAAVDAAPGSAKIAVLDVGDTNMHAEEEVRIRKELNASGLPPLQCDAVLNSPKTATELTRVPAGEKRLVMFWTPVCEPCKPLLADMVALAASKPQGLSVVSVVRSAIADLEAPGDWRMERVKRIVAEYKVGFPTCVHNSSRVTNDWRAGGVPITYLLSDKGVERVASGGTNGSALVAELAAAAKAGKH